ncbi:MAG: hypothetical protein ACHQEM_06000 [Chitinophagales bacterium]
MKPYLSFLLLCLALKANAQFDESSSQIKASIGFATEFPGLSGYAANLEYSLPVIPAFRAGLGTRYINLSGYPRTDQVNEFTHAETIDFNGYWLPFSSERQVISLGIGYSFCFYNIRRAYPIMDGENGKVTNWFVQESSGRSSGVNLFCEYAYHFPNSAWSAGFRAAWYKSYTRVYYLGPVVGIQF